MAINRIEKAINSTLAATPDDPVRHLGERLCKGVRRAAYTRPIYDDEAPGMVDWDKAYSRGFGEVTRVQAIGGQVSVTDSVHTWDRFFLRKQDERAEALGPRASSCPVPHSSRTPGDSIVG